MEEFSNSDIIKSFVAPNMTYLITFLDNNGKFSAYIGVNIHGVCSYLEIIGYPKTVTPSGQRSHHFGPSYSIKNYTAYL